MATKIEKTAPELTEIARQIGLPINFRAGEYWLDNEVQLTFHQEAKTGRVYDLAGKAETAGIIMRRVLEARQQPGWGTREERARRVLEGLRDETLPEFLPRHFCHWRHQSLDDGCISSFFGKKYVSVDLVGEKRIEVEDTTWEAAIARAATAFGVELKPVSVGSGTSA